METPGADLCRDSAPVGRRLASARSREPSLRAGLRGGQSVYAIAKAVGVLPETLLEDCGRLRIDYAAHERRHKRQWAAEAAREKLCDEEDAAQPPQNPAGACAAHFADLARGYPGRKLASLRIAPGYGTRLSRLYSQVPTGSIAGDCADLGERC